VKLRRDIAAVPLRSGAATWTAIVDLVTKADSIDVGQLSAAATVMATLLSEDHYADHPLTLSGDGARLVIYCAYSAEAMALGMSVNALNWNPTAKDWALYVPCEEDDLEWVKAALASRAPRLLVHALKDNPAVLKEEASVTAAADFQIDWSAA
jgi:hypothetical protein